MNEPRRIVSLVPSLSELLCDLGAAERLVGVTTFCTEPVEVCPSLPTVGGTKNPDLDTIGELAPDLILFDRDENRRVDYDELCGRGFRCVAFEVRSVADARDAVRQLGVMVDGEPTATAITTELDTVLAERSAGVAPDRGLNVFCPIWRNPWMSFNDATYAADLLRLCGARNVCGGGEEMYPRVDLEEIARCEPSVVLLPDEPYVFTEKHIPDLEPLAASEAWRKKRIHLVDGKALFWYGRRTTEAIRWLSALLAGN